MEELLKKVRALELVARKHVSSLLTGSYLSSIKGTGMVFYEARKYVHGESIRQIDWNITARMREPYVKEVHDERQREVIICLDVSPSMYSGWQQLNKIEYAVEVAATLAVSAIEVKDLIGWALFSDKVHSWEPTAGSRAQLFRALRQFVEFRDGEPVAADVSDPRVAIHRVQQQRGKRYAVFIISDFIDRDVPEDIKYIQARHDVTLFHVHDPLEFAAHPSMMLMGASPEDSKGATVWRPGSSGPVSDLLFDLAEQSRKLGIDFHSLDTSKPIHLELMRFFYRKKRSA